MKAAGLNEKATSGCAAATGKRHYCLGAEKSTGVTGPGVCRGARGWRDGLFSYFYCLENGRF